MYELVEIREDFYFLKYTGRSWPTSSNIFLIVDDDGLNIIDAGLNKQQETEGILKCMKKKGLDPSDIHTIFLSHGHTDHIAGVNFFKDYCNPRIFLSEQSICEAIDPKAQEEAVLPMFVRENAPYLMNYNILEEFNNSCGEWILDASQILPLYDGDKIKMGKYVFEAIVVPGHDIGLMVFYETKHKILLSTDLLRASRPGNVLPWYATSTGGVGAYLHSLGEIKFLDTREVYPSHGMIKLALPDAIQQTLLIILDRELKIINALRDSPKKCKQLDSLLFDDALWELCPWATSVTVAHLQKLLTEGLVERDSDMFIWTQDDFT